MTDDRSSEDPAHGDPSPVFGAFATPEEQARRRGAEQSASLERADETPPRSSDVRPWAATPTGESVSGTTGTPTYSWTTERPRSRFVTSGADRIITLVLLALGVINVISSAPQLLEFGAAIQMVYASLDGGEFTATALADAMGRTALIAQVVVLVAVVFWSWARLRATRAAWWVPVLGAAVAWLLVTLAVVVVMLADPPVVASVVGS